MDYEIKGWLREHNLPSNRQAVRTVKTYLREHGLLNKSTRQLLQHQEMADLITEGTVDMIDTQTIPEPFNTLREFYLAHIDDRADEQTLLDFFTFLDHTRLYGVWPLSTYQLLEWRREDIVGLFVGDEHEMELPIVIGPSQEHRTSGAA
jgi:hypothetical protein